MTEEQMKLSMARLECSIKESVQKFVDETGWFPDVQIVTTLENRIWGVSVKGASSIGSRGKT